MASYFIGLTHFVGALIPSTVHLAAILISVVDVIGVVLNWPGCLFSEKIGFMGRSS